MTTAGVKGLNVIPGENLTLRLKIVTNCLLPTHWDWLWVINVHYYQLL